jgi:hypothetical protein
VVQGRLLARRHKQQQTRNENKRLLIAANASGHNWSQSSRWRPGLFDDERGQQTDWGFRALQFSRLNGVKESLSEESQDVGHVTS